MSVDAATMQAAAFHEAGHAVAAASMGYDVFGCFVDEHGVGTTSVRWPAEQAETETGRRRWLMVVAAGDVAEIIGLGRTDDPRMLDVDAGDAAHHFAWLAASTQERADGDLLQERAHAEITTARAAAHKLLAAQWSDVQGIAAILTPSMGSA